MRNLSTVAIALGHERTRNELLPYILGKCLKIKSIDLMDDEEEVLLTLAEILGGFMDYAGGPAYAFYVLRPLEKLCQVEENSVRDKVLRYYNL